MTNAETLSPPVEPGFIVDALGRGFSRIAESPVRAAWLFAWDATTALALILIGAWFVMAPGMDEPQGLVGVLFMLAVFVRRVISETAWLRFYLSEDEARPNAPFRLGGDEWRVLGAGFVAGFAVTMFGSIIFIPIMIALIAFDPSGGVLWLPFLAILLGFLVLFPRFLIALALTVQQKRFAPFEDLAASGRVWGRSIAVAAYIVASVLVALMIAGTLFEVAGAAGDFQSFGARVDVIYNWALTAPLSATDWAVLACTALGASFFWTQARGAAAHAALTLQDSAASTPPASPDAPGPA
ncbi:MAG: hypothetical protein RIA71_11770 [Oceanicaulis sp.]